MKSIKMFACILVACLCLVPFGAMAMDAYGDNTEGTVEFGTKSITATGFTDKDDGTLTIYVTNVDDANSCEVMIAVTDYEDDSGNRVLASTESYIAVPAGADNFEITLTFGFESSGTKQVTVTIIDKKDNIIDVERPVEIAVAHKESEAMDKIEFGTESINTSGFTDMDNGTLKAYISNSDAEKAFTIKLVVTDYVTGAVKGSVTKEIPAGAKNVEVSVSFGYGSSGSEFVKVTIYDHDDIKLDSSGPYEITVKHSIWKDWVTYLVVVIIIIVIIILAYFYIRGAPDRAAKKMSLKQKDTKAVSTGRTKYDAGSKKKSKRE